MADTARRPFVPEYEPQTWVGYPNDDDGRLLNDDEVLRLLSGANDPFTSDRDHVDSGEAEYVHDDLASARAIAIGATLASPFWLLIAAILM